MNFQSTTFREFSPVKFLVFAAFAVTAGIPAQAAEKVAQSSGTWNSIGWVTSGTPTTGDNVYITNNYSVDYTAGNTSINRVYVGDPVGSPASENGTLTISSGTLATTANTTGAIRIGNSSTGTSTLNVTGGLMQAGGTGWLNVGAVANANGNVTISGGKVVADSVVLSTADGAKANLLVNGGTLESSGDLYVGRRIVATTSGTFTMTSGTTTVVGAANYLSVGYAGGSTQIMNSRASITGGTFTGNIRVGRQSSVASGGGVGTLLIGSVANITGKTASLDVSGNGEIIFQLGATDAFNAVDLTAASGVALDFTQLGAKITIDGTNLAFSSSYSPITLISFASGHAPTTTSNVTYAFTGFDPQFGTPSLAWTDTSLQLTVVPEPSSIALALLVVGLGVVGTRRRQSRA